MAYTDKITVAVSSLEEKKMTKYVKVAIYSKNDATDHLYIYKTDEDIELGDKVGVHFGKTSGMIAGYVFEVSDKEFENSDNYKLKKIKRIDRDESLPPHAISVSNWMRRRYFCRAYDAAALFSSPVKKTAKRKSKVPGLPDLSELSKKDGLPTLTQEQAGVFDSIARQMDTGEYKTFLLQGVTGSGKTEVYIHTAMKALQADKSIVVLVPEISLTPQTIRRFVACFGTEKIAIMHSRLSAGERYNEYMRIKRGEAKIIIGARSAVFAPVSNLGAIIIDEEHETTYKSDQNPGYFAIEVAIKISIAQRATVILGSATPSVVSMYRAKRGIYTLLRLKERYNKAPLPQIELVDMRKELLAGNRSIFSERLYKAMQETLGAGKQAILFLNRRGYFTLVTCRSCGYMAICPTCGISMTYHKERSSVECHFCGNKTAAPSRCPLCDSAYLRFTGIGTEQLEKLSQESFELAKISRMDADTTGNKGSMAMLLEEFSSRRTNVLIGTQMVAKGLDFLDVTAVGIVAADLGLSIPDFRAAERTFSLITQVAGRSGRGKSKGRVIAQTYDVNHYAIKMAVAYDYDGFFAKEISLRRDFDYPPFSDVFVLRITSPQEDLAICQTNDIIDKILKHFGEAERQFVLGPAPDRIRYYEDVYRYRISIKVLPHKREAYEDFLAGLRLEINVNCSDDVYLYIDVNPTFIT